MSTKQPHTNRKSKAAPPTATGEEAAFLASLSQKLTPVHIKLRDGESLSGWIEYYDENMVRLTREGAPNLFIFKHQIAYIAEATHTRSES
jgi:host factor-I protein